VEELKGDSYMQWNRSDTDNRLSQHFSKTEFNCQCGNCTLQKVDEELLEALEKVRFEYGKPISISSGFRCHEHQVELGKMFETAKGVSQHELGRAVDIIVDDNTSKILLPILEKYFEAIGIAKNFIHVDLRRGVKRRWVYGKV
jgi:zinc D-Ala-D-Ala carboxypeptidase